MADKKVIYNSGRGFVSGIPARDLTMDEWEALSKELQEIAINSGVYKMSGVPAKETKKEGDE
jgi:hypothetical protein